MKKINLYFDFDGTLFDSKKGISLAIQKSAKEVYNIDFDVPNEIIGPPISIIHDLIFRGHNKKDEFIKSFRNYYDNIYYIFSSPYYKRVDFFSDLVSINCNLNIVSNKPTNIINKILNINNIDKYFNHISGNSEVNSLKKERLNKLVKLEKLACESIVIGDTIEDFEMANYTNCKFIFAKYGYGNISEDVVCLDELDFLIKLLQK